MLSINFVKFIYLLSVYVYSVRSESARESFWDVKELMDYNFLFSHMCKFIVSL